MPNEMMWFYIALAIIVIGGLLIAGKAFVSRSKEPAPMERDVLTLDTPVDND